MSHPLSIVKNERPEADYEQVIVIPRQQFVDQWNYKPGQHVTMLGPTRRGKTTLCFQLLDKSISTTHKCVILAGKPPGRDPTMESAPKILNLRVIEEWPPYPSLKDRKTRGYMLRPRQHMKDINDDNAELARQFKGAINSNYRTNSKRPRITVVDESGLVQEDLKLRKEIEAPLMRGAPDNAVWSLAQRGRFLSYHTYGAPEHIFIFYDPDRDNQRRYSDIGGVDPDQLKPILANLKREQNKEGTTISQCLYIRRSGGMCIVDTR